jgi:hypothetical protein
VPGLMRDVSSPGRSEGILSPQAGTTGKSAGHEKEADDGRGWRSLRGRPSSAPSKDHALRKALSQPGYRADACTYFPAEWNFCCALRSPSSTSAYTASAASPIKNGNSFFFRQPDTRGGDQHPHHIDQHEHNQLAHRIGLAPPPERPVPVGQPGKQGGHRGRDQPRLDLAVRHGPVDQQPVQPVVL